MRNLEEYIEEGFFQNVGNNITDIDEILSEVFMRNFRYICRRNDKNPDFKYYQYGYDIKVDKESRKIIVHKTSNKTHKKDIEFDFLNIDKRTIDKLKSYETRLWDFYETTKKYVLKIMHYSADMKFTPGHVVYIEISKDNRDTINTKIFEGFFQNIGANKVQKLDEIFSKLHISRYVNYNIFYDTNKYLITFRDKALKTSKSDIIFDFLNCDDDIVDAIYDYAKNKRFIYIKIKNNRTLNNYINSYIKSQYGGPIIEFGDPISMDIKITYDPKTYEMELYRR